MTYTHSFKFDNTQIIVQNVPEDEYGGLVCEAIEITVKHHINHIISIFDILVFDIKDFSKHSAINNDLIAATAEMKNGKVTNPPTISLYSVPIKKMIRETGLISLESTLVHEFTHLFHAKVSKQFIRMRSRIDGLGDKIDKMMIEKATPFNCLLIMRLFITSFQEKLLTEGLAVYTEKIFTDAIDSKKLLQYSDYILYLKECWEEIKKLKNSPLEMTEKIVGRDTFSFTSLLKSLPYTFGTYMVITILISKLASFGELCQMTATKFIKTYEKAEKQLGGQPRISLTSGEGVFDIKSFLADLNQFIKEYKQLYHKESF